MEIRPAEMPSDDTAKLTGMPQLAKVVGHYDPTFMGKLQVEILREGAGNSPTQSQVQTVEMITPFYSTTSPDYISETPDDYNNTQKSAGMWFVPPDVGTTVVVIFINGNPKRGYWLGCVPDNLINFMVPGYASTSFNVSDTKTVDPERIPVAEVNKKVNEFPSVEASKLPKPEHPFAKMLKDQGLLEDDTRGITTSSARREAPSAVFGFNTPGPIDKQEGAKKGPRGTKEGLIPDAFVSRLGGSSFVMDDGDDKFLRKKTPSEGPPEYVAIEQGEEDGNVTIPHNELVRIRTRTGHQILLHNSEDLIYITNSRGTAWVELTSDGKIDIYAQDSISIRTENDFNFYANRDINLEAGRNFNVKATNRTQIESGGNTNLVVGGDGKITVSGKFDLNSGGTNKFTSGGDCHILAANTGIDGGNINLNSGVATAAASASPLSTFNNVTEKDGTTIKSIMLRVPTTEPYPHHEHLDPLKFKSDKTDRESGSAVPKPEYYKKYTTKTDTFAKVLPPEPEAQEEEEQ